MHIDLTPEEFEHLLKLAYLGEAVANDWTPTDRQNGEQLAMTDVLCDLCEKAKDTPVAGYVTCDEKTGEWIPSHALDQEMDEHISRYDNEIFWDELISRLAHRDLLAEYGPALDTMSDTYRSQAELSLLQFYSREVCDNGLERLIVDDEETKLLKRRSKSRGNKRGRTRPSLPLEPGQEAV